MTPLTPYPTIIVAILSLDNRSLLLKNLQWINSLYKSLPEELQQYFYCFVSDNASSDGSEEILHDFSKGKSWFSYYIQPEHVHFDLNVLTCYEKSSTDYVWLLAVDDYICSHENIMEIFKILREYGPSGVTFQISPERKLCQLSGKDIKLLSNPCDVVWAIEVGGKISCNIIKKIQGLDRNNEKIVPFIGVGYMHSTLQAVCYELLEKNDFLRIEQQLVYSSQFIGDGEKNKYHPKYALNSKDCIATNYFTQNCPQFFKILDDKRIMKLKWIIHQSIFQRTINSWDEKLLTHFIQTTIRESISHPLNIKIMIFLIIALFSLMPYPYLFKSAIISLFRYQGEDVEDYVR